MSVAGIVNLFKPAGVTSAKYVYRLRNVFSERRVGHAGSLDPFAEGVLLGCVGAATKLVEQLMELPKQYEVTLRLGVTNVTQDTETHTQPVCDAVPPTINDIEQTLASWIGLRMQTPHAYSAIKIAGRSAHDLARRGQSPALVERPVRIDRLEVMAYEWPLLRLRITCGRGFYVRALARDLGTEWNCGAICETLKRTRVGPFVAEDAVKLDDTDPARVRDALMDVEAARTLLEVIRRSGEDTPRSV